MFDLESELLKWRQQMIASGLTSADAIRELEEHLREEIGHQVRKGETLSAAFQGACERLGSPADLSREFEVTYPTGIAGLWVRHGKKISVCVGLGVMISAITQGMGPFSYVSETKFFVRPALEISSQEPASGGSRLAAMTISDTLIEDVARAVGPSLVLKKVGAGDDLAQAATIIRDGLSWAKEDAAASDLRLNFRHADAEVRDLVLRELTARIQPPHTKSPTFSPIDALEAHRIAEHTADIMALISDPLFEDVARRIGPSALLKKNGGGDDLVQAVAILRAGLCATTHSGSSVVHLRFRHPESNIVQPVLREIIDCLRELGPQVTAEQLRVSPDGISLSTAPVTSVAPIQAPSLPRFDTSMIIRQSGAALSTGIILGLVAALILVLRTHRTRQHARVD